MMHTYLDPSTFRLLGTLTASLWIATAAHSVMSQAAPAQKSVGDGVYSAAQADRGEALFTSACASCHAPADFTGDEFLKKWTGKELHALFDIVQSTMPMDSPGSLKPEQYADVVAYFLKLNKFPAGDDELKGTPEAMKAIKLDKKG